MGSQLLGGILLILGTSIGAGMLGLPVVTAELGFSGSVILLVSCWLVSLISAFLLLEVSLWFPVGCNFISMAQATLGTPGKMLSWITYLLFLYALVCAYIASGSDILCGLLFASGLQLSTNLVAVIFTVIFATIVYSGIRAIDYVNRWLMLLKIMAYIALVTSLLPAIHLENLVHGNLQKIVGVSVITITITAFGFAVLIPSLRTYFGDDIAALKKAIFIGSFIPLVCYLIWNLVIIGVIPFHGENSFYTILHSHNVTVALLNTLHVRVDNERIHMFARLFTGICVFTSLLGVSLCLTDFLTDGFAATKIIVRKITVNIITFAPALLIVILYPNVFLKSLQYAGIYLVVLSILLPALMVWVGRYRKKFTTEFEVFGGKLLLALTIIGSLTFIMCNVIALI